MKTRYHSLRLVIAEDKDAGIIWGNGRMVRGRNKILSSITRLDLKRYEWGCSQ